MSIWMCPAQYRQGLQRARRLWSLRMDAAGCEQSKTQLLALNSDQDVARLNSPARARCLSPATPIPWSSGRKVKEHVLPAPETVANVAQRWEEQEVRCLPGGTRSEGENACRQRAKVAEGRRFASRDGVPPRTLGA